MIAPFCTSGKESPAEAWCEMVRRGFARPSAASRSRSAVRACELVRATARRCEAAPDGDGAPRAGAARRSRLAGDAGRRRNAEPAPPSGRRARSRRPIVRPVPATGPCARRAPARRSRPRPPRAAAGVVPERRREVAGEASSRRARRGSPADERSGIVADALAVLGHAALAPLFGPGSRAEVAIAGHIATRRRGRPVSGQIDRLAVLDDEVLLADLQDDRTPAATATSPRRAAYVAQLALYRRAAQDIYPGRRVRAFLIWTAGPPVQELRAERPRPGARPRHGRVTACAALP